MAMDDLLKHDFWKQPWATFQNDFWVMLPLFVIVVVGVWWLRGRLFEAQLGGLKEQIAALEQRLKLATDLTAASDKAKDEVETQLQTLEVAIAGKADVASLSALAAKLDNAVGQWATANNAVSNAVSRNTPWLDQGSGLEGVRSGFAAGSLGQRR